MSCARESTPATTRDSATGCRGQFTPPLVLSSHPRHGHRKGSRTRSMQRPAQRQKSPTPNVVRTQRASVIRRADRGDNVSRFRGRPCCSQCGRRVVIGAPRSRLIQRGGCRQRQLCERSVRFGQTFLLPQGPHGAPSAGQVRRGRHRSNLAVSAAFRGRLAVFPAFQRKYERCVRDARRTSH